jgi:TPR repeat protein
MLFSGAAVPQRAAIFASDQEAAPRRNSDPQEKPSAQGEAQKESEASVYEQRCHAREAGACTTLGLMYEKARGVRKDLRRATALYGQGCDAGDAEGCTSLGWLYQSGIGLAKDPARARALYQRGCDGGNLRGCVNLGLMYAAGRGVPRDEARAAPLFVRACDGGFVSACGQLGFMYENGRGGIAKDEVQAGALYKRACDEGDAWACRHLGLLDSRGSGALKGGEWAIPPISQAGPFALEAKAVPLGKLVEDAREETLTVSPDGKRVAYITGTVEDGWPQPEHIWQTVFLPGAEVGIAGRRARGHRRGSSSSQALKLRVVVDGEKGPGHTAVSIFPVFSPDGRRVAYGAGDKSGLLGMALDETIVIDGTVGKHYDEVGTPVFSPDSRHVTYRAFRENRWRMVVDGTEGDEYESMLNIPIFSPDNQRVAYIGGRWKKLFVVNGQHANEVSATDGGNLVFSPDGRRLACVLAKGRQAFVYLDGVEGATYDSIGVPVFTSDGRLAYAAARGATWYTVIEGSEPTQHAEYPQVGDAVFSSDGQRLAFRATSGSQEVAVVDGVAGKPYDEIGRLAFSPDGQHFVFEARLGSTWRVVVDGSEGPDYVPVKEFAVERGWRLLHRRGWVFERPDLLTYVGVSDGQIVRREVRISARSVPP